MDLNGMSTAQLEALREKVDTELGRKSEEHLTGPFSKYSKSKMKEFLFSGEGSLSGTIHMCKGLAQKENLDWQTFLSLVVCHLNTQINRLEKKLLDEYNKIGNHLIDPLYRSWIESISPEEQRKHLGLEAPKNDASIINWKE